MSGPRKELKDLLARVLAFMDDDGSISDSERRDLREDVEVLFHQKELEQELEIEAVLVATTAHALPSDFARMREETEHPQLVVYESEYGAWVNVSEHSPPDENWSAGFRAVWKRALDLRLEWVKFDRDGPEIDDIGTYEW